MKPLIYSEKSALSKGVGWIREGGDICYYTNNMKRKFGGYYSSLSFTLRFERSQLLIQMTMTQSTLLIAIPIPIQDCKNI
jgi:hypothetical protein